MRGRRISFGGNLGASDLIPYLDALDVARLDASNRLLISATIVPALLRKIAARGLDVLVSRSLEPLAAFHQRRRDGLGLSPIFNPVYQLDADSTNALALFLVNAGEPVGAVGCRLKWCEGTLADELESLRVFYTDPPTMARLTETCVVTARSAREEIQSCPVAISGAGYMAGQARGGGMFKALFRLLHVLMLGWRWSWEVALIREEQPNSLSVNAYGFRGLDPFVILGGRRYYLASSRRREAREQLLRPDVAELQSLAEPTAADFERARAAVRE